MISGIRWIFIASLLTIAVAQNNPSIIEDTRLHPTSDGTFGFLYRTQDGISHAAKGDPGGAVHGRFTYTDPTGLKVNFNYNAGAQAIAQKQAEQQQQPQYQPQYQQPQPRYQPQPQPQPQPQAQPQYQQEYQPRPVPQSRYRMVPVQEPQPQPQRYTTAQYQDNYQQGYDQQARYSNPAPRYQPRYEPQQNEIYDYDYDRYRQ